MATFRQHAFMQNLRDYMMAERGSLNKSAAAPIEYPQLTPAPEAGAPGIDPAILEQIAAATGMDPQQLAQMPPDQLDQLMQELQVAPQQEGAPQEGQSGSVPTLNISAKGDMAVQTVNNMMGTQKMASYDGATACAGYLACKGGHGRNALAGVKKMFDKQAAAKAQEKTVAFNANLKAFMEADRKDYMAKKAACDAKPAAKSAAPAPAKSAPAAAAGQVAGKAVAKGSAAIDKIKQRMANMVKSRQAAAPAAK